MIAKENAQNCTKMHEIGQKQQICEDKFVVKDKNYWKVAIIVTIQENVKALHIQYAICVKKIALFQWQLTTWQTLIIT